MGRGDGGRHAGRHGRSPEGHEEHPIKHAVSFHGSIQRAELFKAHNDTFTQEFPEFGGLETFHVSGQTPTGTRSNIIKAFARADRSLVTNARCLTEGVDVPGIDCVLFADPRKSTVDIVQAVGRALRPSEGKKLGYVILPVLHETDATSEQVIDSGAFKEILTTISALAANDDRIIEYFRGISQGRNPSGSSRVSFEWDERLAQNIDVAKLVHELEIKCWGRLAKLSWRPFEEAREFAHSLNLQTRTAWADYCEGSNQLVPPPPFDIPKSPHKVYASSGWENWGDWLGTGRISNQKKIWRSFEDARRFAQSLGLKSGAEWDDFCQGKLKLAEQLPSDVPAAPFTVYKDSGWLGMGDWIGTGTLAPSLRKFKPFIEARDFVRSLGLKSLNEWRLYCTGKLSGKEPCPSDIPKHPNSTYANEGWIDIGDWIGTFSKTNRGRTYDPFPEAREYARSLKLKNGSEWVDYCRKKLIPEKIAADPARIYRADGWINMADWLGTANYRGGHRPFEEARAFVHSLGLKSQSEWTRYSKNLMPHLGQRPLDIPAIPRTAYKNKGWIDMGDWLGTMRKADVQKAYRPFDEAVIYVGALGLTSYKDWRNWCKGLKSNIPAKPDDIPTKPERTYKTQWLGWNKWLGTKRSGKNERAFRSFEKARDLAQSLNLSTWSEWLKFARQKMPEKGQRPIDIPIHPELSYKSQGWVGVGDWLGTGSIAPAKMEYMPFPLARAFVRKLRLKSSAQWDNYCAGKMPHLPPKPDNIPRAAGRTYSKSGWVSVGDWLGTGMVATQNREYLDYQSAERIVHRLNIRSNKEWRMLIKGELPGKTLPKIIPLNPDSTYQNNGWSSWGAWLGTRSVHEKSVRPFPEARKFVHSLGLKTQKDWQLYVTGGMPHLPRLPADIPSSAARKYAENWISWSDWLGNGGAPNRKKA